MAANLAQKDYDERLKEGRQLLSFLKAHNNDILPGRGLIWQEKTPLEADCLMLFHIDKITFEEKAPRREALENILGTFRSSGHSGLRFIYLILGSGSRVDFYFGIACDTNCDVYDIAQDMLAPGIKGNFRGSNIKLVDGDEKQVIFDRLRKVNFCGMLEGVPGVDKDASGRTGENFQGTDRLIDTMFGSEFGMAVIAKPYSSSGIEEIENSLYEIYDRLVPLAKYSLQRTKSDTENKNESSTHAYSKQNSKSSQTNDSTSRSNTESSSSDKRVDKSNQIQASASESVTKQYSSSDSYSDSNNSGSNKHYDATQSKSDGTMSSTARNDVCSNSYGEAQTEAISTNKVKSSAHSATEGFSENTSDSNSSTQATITNHTAAKIEQLPVESKLAASWLEYIDKVLLPRVDSGKGKGLFLYCAYLFSDTKTVLERLANTAASLYSASAGNRSALRFVMLDEVEDAGCIKLLQNLDIPSAVGRDFDRAAWNVACTRSMDGEAACCGSWVSSQELAIISGLPQKEVVGLSLRKEVEFGLNQTVEVQEQKRIELGCLVQAGEEVENVPIYIDRENLDKHTFIAGVTGSGKTNTCQNILLDCGLPFLIIEPAKTEYRKKFFKEHFDDIIYFTPGRQNTAPFFLNPFELFPGEAINSRADMLKATMEASFEMEAAIPQILETAIYRVYEEKGWNIGDNTWHGKDETDLEDGPFADGVYAFPTMSDFLAAAIKIADEQGFGDRLGDEYKGSLRARINGLLVGAKGQMLNTPRSVDFRELVDRHVVIELEEIKNGAEKSLLMGFILTNLLQAVKSKYKENKHFQHITLVEEAHRLLSRYTPGDSLNKRQGVEVFSDMLAEVRKYGESLIIVDQIPEKMTPEVLKNTNTKIVHKLFAKDDKDVIGNTMALEEDQKDFLSNLDTGKAIVFTQGWTKAVQVKIKSLQADDDEDISTAQIEQIAVEYYKDNYRRGVLRGLEKVPQEMTDTLVQKYLWLKRSDQSLEAYGKFINCSGEEYGEKLFFNLQGKINKSLAKIGGDSEL